MYPKKKSIALVVMGDPTPLARPRYSANRRVYDSQRERKMIVGIDMHRQLPETFEQLSGAISLQINFYMPISTNLSRVKREARLGKFHLSRPDLSNLIKFYEDIGTDIGIYKDDSLIAVIQSKKIYDYVPRTEIIFEEIL